MVRCSRCREQLDAVVPGWCPGCGRTERIGAAALLAWLLDDAMPVLGVEGAHEPTGPDPLGWPGYEARRQSARLATGADESVTVGRGTIAGAEVVAVAWDFGFLGGSMGTVAGQRIAAAYDAARTARLPVLLLTATGGARMQEGMASLAQLAATTAAASAHAEAGLLQVAVLRDPTTGGVLASHANQADVLLAEPGATIGFAGPRVAAAVTDGPLPSGSHTATGAHAAGLVDAVVARPDLPEALGDVLRWGHLAAARDLDTTAPGDDPTRTTAPEQSPATADSDPWQQVQRARAADRLRARAVLDHVDVEVVARLRGDRAGGVDPSVDVACATWARRPVVVVAMDPIPGAITPAGYRTVWRGIDLAQQLGVPLVTLVDTPGADPSASSEAGGIAHHIAATLQRVLAATVPVVSAVIGEGGSGGALALAVGDRLLIQEHAIFTVIAPEGAAAILHRDRERAPEVARLLDPTATRLFDLRIADEVLPEPAGAELDTLVEAVGRHLTELHTGNGSSGVELVASRRDRWRRPLR